jgi:hypothetical protein
MKSAVWMGETDIFRWRDRMRWAGSYPFGHPARLQYLDEACEIIQESVTWIDAGDLQNSKSQ